MCRAMARVLKPSGEFRFVSDIDDYCAWTLAHLVRSPDFRWMAERADDWRKPWDGYTMTRYGRKAEREGRVASYLRFQRSLKSSFRGDAKHRTRIARFRVRRLRLCPARQLYCFAIRAFFASVASHTMRFPRSRPSSSIGS